MIPCNSTREHSVTKSRIKWAKMDKIQRRKGGLIMQSAQAYIYMENCKENMEWYAAIFQGKLQNIQFADQNKKPCQENEGEYILHGELVIGDSLIHFCDPFEPKKQGNHIQIVLKFDHENEIHSVYDKLSKDGHIIMPLQETFWNSIHGHVVDRNGIPWILDYQKVSM